MSMEACMAVLTTPTLSSGAVNKLHLLNGVGAIDWTTLWPLILKYGALAVQALEEILPLIGVGTPWTEILSAILAALTKLTGQSVTV